MRRTTEFRASRGTTGSASGRRPDESFVAEWEAGLAEIPFDAYCLEAPPLTKRMLSEWFECVFVDSPLLVRQEASVVIAMQTNQQLHAI